MPDPIQSTPEAPRQFQSLEEFVIVLNALQKLTRPLSAAPTFTPQNFLQQIQFVDDGVTKSVYVYINKTWVQLGSGGGGDLPVYVAPDDTAISITAGLGSSSGKNLSVIAGDGTGSGHGGEINVFSGVGGVTGDGGDISIIA